MTEELVTYPTAKLAREKGFDEVCRATFEAYEHNGEMVVSESPDIPTLLADLSEDLRAMLVKRPGLWDGVPIHNSTLKPWLTARPSQDLLERWLREKHDTDITIKMWRRKGRKYQAVIKKHGKYETAGRLFNTFEPAREGALMHGLKMIP